MASVAHDRVDAPPRWNLRRGVLVFVAVLVVQILAAGAWAAYQGLAARGELEDARAAAGDGRAALTDFDLEAAGTAFRAASADFDAGYERLSGPIVRAATVLPLVGDDVAAARTLAWGGREVADAALEVTTVAQGLGGLSAFAPRDGRLPVDAIAELAPSTAQAHTTVVAVTDAVEQLPADGLLGPVDAARSQFLGEAVEAEALLGDAAEVTAVLPGILGADDSRRYLFAAQNPAELRGTGGFMGAYAVLEIDEGRLSFSDFTPIQELTSLHVSEVRAPSSDFAARYDRFGGAGFWQAINFTPDFPSAATAMERLWEQTEGTNVDGVIAVDPMAFEALLAISGPVDVPGIGAVGADEVVEVVVNEAYGAFEDHDRRKEVLGSIAAGALGGALGGGEVGALEAADEVLRIARTGHLKMHASAPHEQSLIRDFGFAGELLDPPGDFLSVVVNSGSFTKLDFYTDRHVDYRVQLHADGSADAVATVTFTNEAPTEGLPKRVIGPGYNGELEIGENRSYVSVFCDVGCELESGDDLRVEEELGHGVASRFMTVKSGQEAQMVSRWHAPQAWDPATGEYLLTYQAQPTLRATTLDVQVRAPAEYDLADGGQWRGRVEGSQTITFPLQQS